MEEEVSVVEEEEVEAALVEDHSKEARVEQQQLPTSMAITEGKKHVKMYMMNRSVEANPAKSNSYCSRLCSGAAAVSTCYPCLTSAACVTLISGLGNTAVSRRRKLHKLRKDLRQEMK